MRKTFDIKDKKILDHLNKQHNQTQYIISLIRKDMKNTQAITREMVIEIIEEYLARQKINRTANIRDEQVENSINNVLDMLK